MDFLRRRLVNGASVEMLACLCCILVAGVAVFASSPAQAELSPFKLKQVQNALKSAGKKDIAQAAVEVFIRMGVEQRDSAAEIAAQAAKLYPDMASDIAVAMAIEVPDMATEIAQAVVNEAPEQVDAVNRAMAKEIPDWTNVTTTKPTTTTPTDTTATTSTTSSTSTTETTTTLASPSSELLNRLASARGL
ncbi:MAG: hypothetical protein KQI62_06580 [Deltaproteobacteria bacterium]|nr:hypothetical protein [Deltaproteobacteria bacterium]